jgi:hypothetical protein
MKLYRFSPIKSKVELLEAIKHIHFECYKLCKASFGRYLLNAGNVGVFCHYEDEYKYLTSIRKEMTEESDNVNQKYFRLQNSIVIPAKDDIPETTYTHLYIRKPDQSAYGKYVGDVDFVLEEDEYTKIKNKLLNGEAIKGAEIYDRPGWDTIQITDTDVDAIAFLSTKEFSEKVRVKFTEDTKL